MKNILITGIKPTGIIHFGNYFGAIRQFIELSEKYDTRIFIADYHALNTVHSGEELSKNIFNILCDYLALGLDPEKVIIFKQSDTPQVTELTTILNTLITVPFLMRAHAYKDAEAKGRETNVGTFVYPVLMASDILIHDANIVPVGQDQQQHIEYARDIAEKFNYVFGETFVLPEAYIQKESAIFPGIDGQKMSKSYKNIIPFFADKEEITSLVMRIPTDSRQPQEEKDVDSILLYQIHKFFNASDDLKQKYQKGMSYKEAKERLIEDICTFTESFRKRREEIAGRPEYVLEVLRQGGERAREITEKKIRIIRKRIGLDL